MTEYPTREAIDAAAETITTLHYQADTDTLLGSTLAGVLYHAARILENLDAIPGLHYPAEHQPQRTPSEVLAAAEQHATVGSPEHHILLAAYGYADSHPEWFEAVADMPREMLRTAATRAALDNDHTARLVLFACDYLAETHPDWFGGEA